MTTREEAERSVWGQWGQISARDMGCTMRLASELTEAYEWGWVVLLAPVRPEERRRDRRFDKFACERRTGRSVPIGFKGLSQALSLLAVVTEADRNLPSAEFKALWSRLTTPRTGARNAEAEAAVARVAPDRQGR